LQNFEAFAKGVMSEKIRALRKSIEASGGKAPQQQAASAGELLESFWPRLMADSSRGARKAKSNNPIIMISSSPTALITMWNVKKFLEQGV